MRLGLNLGVGAGSSVDDQLALGREADRLGYDSVWVSEAYGSDAPTLLGALAATTERIGIGSAVMQIPARTPAMTAMTAATLDLLSDGRFRLGLGVSGPQVSEGWHGVRFVKPLQRTREYVDVVTAALARQRLQYAGEHFTLPLPDGPGKAIKLSIRPIREHIPLYLAAVGPKSLQLAGELADGWLAVFFSPAYAAESLAQVRAGLQRRGRALDTFDVVPAVPVAVGADVAACAEPLRQHAALYIGGMGSREQNFYNALAVRMGYSTQAKRCQELYLAGQHRDAAAAVPFEFLDQTCLLGPQSRIAERLPAFAEAGVTTLSVSCFGATLRDRIDTLRTMAAALDASGVGD
jgi:F420-dependent oxidoreductase-like protein